MSYERKLSIVIFTLFFSWLLAFPFQGQVLHMILDKNNIVANNLVFISTAAHFAGLFIAGFFIKTVKQANHFIFFSLIICILGNVLFFLPPSILWSISLLIISFVAGVSVASWSFYFKCFTPVNERIKTAADVLIYSNILMIMINMLAIHLSVYVALAFAVANLVAALFVVARMSKTSTENFDKGKSDGKSLINPIKPFTYLCIFIFVITINSGLMYQVVNPAFENHKWLVSWYWAVPYIIALYIMRNLPERFNRNYILYVGIAMIGLSFTAFMFLDNSARSYFIVNTLMLGACGIYDLFWWSILGEMLEFHENPVKVLGIGLSANVLGVLIGGIIGTYFTSKYFKDGTSIIALFVVFFTLLMLPLLHRQLVKLLKNHVYLTALYEMEPKTQNKTIEDFLYSGALTQRENEIAVLLLKGWTYKMIANELFLSENTIKTHIRNIYSKFQVQSKSELLTLFIDKRDL